MPPSGHFSASISLATALAMVGLPLIVTLLILGRALYNLRLAAAPTAAEEGECVIHGRVAYACDQELAMRVEIDQHGIERDGSGGYWHKWEEVERRMRVAPFYVVREGGTRTRVEPTPDAYLVDAMDGKIVVKTDFRTRYAELTPGEEVWVSGELVRARDPEQAGGYRESGVTLVMRAPRKKPLLVASEPLDKRYRSRARFHGAWTILLAIVTLVSTALAAPFFDRLWGTTTTAKVIAVQHVTNDNDEVTGYDITVVGPAGTMTDKYRNSVPFGTDLSIRSGRHSAQIGERATMHCGYLFALVGVMVAALIYHLRAVGSLPWYRARLEEGGSGRLASS